MIYCQIYGGYEEGGKYYYRLYGAIGLKNAEIELENIAELYGQGKYAVDSRCPNKQDISNCIGLTPEYYNANLTTDNEVAKYGNEVSIFWGGEGNLPRYNATLSENGNLTNEHINGFYWYDYEEEKIKYVPYETEESNEPIITIINDYYSARGIDLLSNDSVIYKMIFTNSDGSKANYWLNSRSKDVCYERADFGVDAVFNDNVGTYNMVASFLGEQGFSGGIRPIVSLEPNIQLTRNNENSSWSIFDCQ